MPKTSTKISRRDAIKLLGAAAGASLLANLPTKWTKPELATGVLPAHAQTSVTLPTVITVGVVLETFNPSLVAVAFVTSPRQQAMPWLLTGKVADDGGSPILANGFVWGNDSTNTSPTLADHHVSVAVVPVGTQFSAAEDLATDIYVRAYATNAAGTGYGTAMQLTFN